jgi:hypothetical protein
MLHQAGLFIHMVAIILVGGGSVGGVMVEKQLWKKIKDRSSEAKALLPLVKSTAGLIMAGIVVFLVSGLIMLYSVHWAYLSQPWFVIKFCLFLMLPLRGALIGRPTMVRVGSQVNQDINNLPEFMKLKSKMNRFHMIQYLIVATILFLVIFKI